MVRPASGWMRARQRGVDPPRVIPGHADRDVPLATIDELGAPELWITHGQ